MKKLAYDVVCLSAAALWAHGALAAEVSLAIAPTNWVTCAPVATATFAAELDSVVLEWAPGDAGAFTQIATCPDPSAETWTVELPGTVVGQPRRYRLAMTSGGSTSYSDPVAFTRFRNLDRNPRDRTALATGVYPVLSADSNSMKPFNAYTGDWADSGSYQNVGLKFTNGKVYVAGIRVYPRSNNIGRLNNRNFFGAESASTYSTDYSAIGYISGLTAAWHYYPSTDTSTAFECCWLKADNGNIAEMEVYGWTDVDLDDAGGAVEIGFVPYSAAETNVWPIVTATYPYGVDSAAIEIGRRVDGDFEAVKSVTSPDGTPFSYTNLECKVGQTRYYRLKTVTGGSVYTSTPKKFTRFRWLERGPETPSAVRSGYSIIAGTSDNAKRPFNGTTSEPKDSVSPCGINFNEQVYVAGVRYYPRPSWAARLSSRYTYASATASDYSAGTKTPITPFLYCASEKWYWYDSEDIDSPYQYVYISPSNGSIGEMEIFGWTAADIAAAADPFFPTELTAINGDAAGKVVLAWGGGLNLDSYSVQYRQQGYEGWTTAVNGLAVDVESYELSGLEMNTTYEFRVVGHAGAESGTSPTASVYVYQLVPGAGTGLNTLLYGPIDSRNLGQRFCFEQRLSPTVDVHRASGSLFSTTNLASAMVIYRGKIILPLAGKYTFTAVVEGSDGSALYIDGSEGFNAFSGASLKKTIHLGARRRVGRPPGADEPAEARGEFGDEPPRRERHLRRLGLCAGDRFCELHSAFLAARQRIVQDDRREGRLWSRPRYACAADARAGRTIYPYGGLPHVFHGWPSEPFRLQVGDIALRQQPKLHLRQRAGGHEGRSRHLRLGRSELEERRRIDAAAAGEAAQGQDDYVLRHGRRQRHLGHAAYDAAGRL